MRGGARDARRTDDDASAGGHFLAAGTAGTRPGCRDCLGLAVQRANAGSVWDYSKVSDMNVALRAHLRDVHGGE